MSYPVIKVNLSSYANTINSDYEFQEFKKPSAALIGIIYSRFKPYQDSMAGLYDRYSATGDKIPIFNRTMSSADKANNKIASNFFKKIVDSKSGYYASKISYSVNASENENYDVDKFNSVINDFVLQNSMQKVNSSVATLAGICGYGVKYIYISEADLKVVDIPAWECVFIGNYCIRYYTTIGIDEKGSDTITYNAEFYDNTNIHFYQSDDSEMSWKYIRSAKHFLSAMPMIQYKNNAEMNPDIDNAGFSIIDTYDTCNSDMANIITQTGNAYLLFSNGEGLPSDPTERANTLKVIKESGVLDMKEGTASYLIKTINDVFFQNMLDRWERDIYAFSDSVNMNEDTFASASGIAMKYKLFALEQAAMKSEREFKASELQLFKIACDYWGNGFEYWDVLATFSRNFPLDLLSEAQTLSTLKGLVSEKTALSQMSFIPDAGKEMELMQSENEDSVDLDSIVTPEEIPVDTSETFIAGDLQK